MIKGEKIFLRAVEPEDLENLYLWENDPQVWKVSLSATLYSKFVLKEYIENSHKSIYELLQQRFIVCKVTDNEPIGTIDLFDFDVHNSRAGVGILIYDKANRGMGYAAESLALLENYCVEVLGLHQLYSNVVSNNEASKSLFWSNGYTCCGVKKEWLRINKEWFDELLYQKIL